MKIVEQKLPQVAWIHFNFLFKSFSSRFPCCIQQRFCLTVMLLGICTLTLVTCCIPLSTLWWFSAGQLLFVSTYLIFFFFFSFLFCFYFVNFWHILLWCFVVLLTFLSLKYLLSQMFYKRMNKTAKIYGAWPWQGRDSAPVMSSRVVLRCASSPACFSVRSLLSGSV